jgi:hypothetical protein
MSLTTKGSSRMKKYRERLKSNPELYKTANQSHAAYVKMKRSEWTEEQKQLNREQSRERMNRYREKKKAKEAVEKKQPRTVVPYDNVEMGVDTEPSTEDAHVDCNGITGDSFSLFFLFLSLSFSLILLCLRNTEKDLSPIQSCTRPQTRAMLPM